MTIYEAHFENSHYREERERPKFSIGRKKGEFYGR
jgi:hypothetical protein